MLVSLSKTCERMKKDVQDDAKLGRLSTEIITWSEETENATLIVDFQFTNDSFTIQ